MKTLCPEEEDSEGLKSDQNGVEILNGPYYFSLDTVLKSDQNGVEITEYMRNIYPKYTIKIRPKWG